jgi:hypothetical protein
VLGRRSSEAGPAWADSARAGKRQADGLGVLAGRKRCWASGERKSEGEGEGKGFPFFLLNFFSNSFFQTFKLRSNKNSCIRIMMLKHLLFLNYFSDV